MAIDSSVKIRDLDRVTLALPVKSDEGREVPAGSTGTVVGEWVVGWAFEVEFTVPFEAEALVLRSDIAAVIPQ